MRTSRCRRSRIACGLGVIAVAILLAGAGAAAPAPEVRQEGKVDQQALIQETQKMANHPPAMTLVWWVPEEFWRVTFSQNPAVTPARAEEFLKVFRPYLIVAVLDGNISPFGAVTYRPEAVVRETLRVVDKAGTAYAPLADDQVGADTKNVLAMMKPAMTAALGPMGQNLNFYVFPGKDAKDQPIAEAKKPGALVVKLGDREFRWKLPLGSLLPPKTCPKCQETCSGAWSFCPWCGTALAKPV